jgi:hypothetical protein
MNDTNAGHTMTTIEDGDAGAAGGADDLKNPTGADNNDALHESAGDGDFKRGEEAGEAGEAPLEGEGEAGTEEGDPAGADAAVEAPAFDPEKFEERLMEKLEAKLKPQEPPRDLTDEEWAKKEEEFGASRQTIKAFTNQNVQVYNAMREYVDSLFAGVHKENRLKEISQEKGFTDAMRYRKGIDQFLSKYDPKHHSNPELLRMAVVYARGLDRSASVQRARNDGERNRRIAGPARPSSPGNGRSGRPGLPALNATQKEVAAKFGMSDAEYAAQLKKRGTPIAI